MSIYKRYGGKKVTAKHPNYSKATWYIYKRIRGQKPIHRSIPEARTREDAETIERVILDRVKNQKYDLQDETGFNEFVDTVYVPYVYLNNENVYVKEIFIKELKKHFGGQALSAITDRDCVVYQYKRLRAPKRGGGRRSNSSVNREMSTLSKIFSLAKRHKLIRENPMSEVGKLKEPPPRKRDLTPEQRQAFWREARKDFLLYHLAILSCVIPARQGQLKAISPEDIHGDWVQVIKSKKKDERGVPLHRLAKKSLEELQGAGMLPFPIRDFRKRWKAAFINSGINKKGGTREENFHPHDLRHVFGSSLIEEQVNPYVVQELFAHSDMKTSAIYISNKPHHLLEAVNKITIQELEGIN